MQTATLTVDLSAVCANYRLLVSRHARHQVAAVVKADAYGLGMRALSQALHDRERCRSFFVATLAEALELREALPDAVIHVFEGLLKGEAKEFRRHHLRPVLNTLEQLETWRKLGEGAPAALHVDTGMCRLGLSLEDLERLPNPVGHAKAAGVTLLMSHLACASDPDDPMNEAQRERFLTARRHFPGIVASLANSSGLFLSDAFHFDLGRPGCSLYGITPNPRQVNPMKNVATWRAPILQIRAIEREQTVGYGATAVVTPGMKVATIAAGYADGLQRRASGRLPAWLAGEACPMLGRVSMDMSCYDVSHIPSAMLENAETMTLMDDTQPVDTLAEAYGTIGYEVLTGLGNRVRRVYS